MKARINQRAKLYKVSWIPANYGGRVSTYVLAMDLLDAQRTFRAEYRHEYPPTLEIDIQTLKKNDKHDSWKWYEVALGIPHGRVNKPYHQTMVLSNKCLIIG